MVIRIGVHGRDYDLLDLGDDPGERILVQCRDVDDAFRALRALTTDQMALVKLRRVAARAAGMGGAVALSDVDVLNLVARLLHSGRLRLAAVHDNRHGGGGASAEAAVAEVRRPERPRSSAPVVTPSELAGRTRVSEPAPPPARVSPPPVVASSYDTTHWIEIELLGADDEPVPGAAYTVVFPDGSEKGGTLDDMGRALLENLAKAGSYEVRFPEFDREACRFTASGGRSAR